MPRFSWVIFKRKLRLRLSLQFPISVLVSRTCLIYSALGSKVVLRTPYKGLFTALSSLGVTATPCAKPTGAPCIYEALALHKILRAADGQKPNGSQLAPFPGSTSLAPCRVPAISHLRFGVTRCGPLRAGERGDCDVCPRDGVACDGWHVCWGGTWSRPTGVGGCKSQTRS